MKRLITKPCRGRLDRSLSDRRRGSNLLEVVVTIGLITAMMGVASSAIHSIFTFDRTVTTSRDFRNAASRLGSTLREDVRSADQVNWDADSHVLRIESKRSVVEYRQTNHRIERVELAGDEQRRVEVYRTMDDAELSFELSAGGDLLTGRLIRKPARSGRELQAGLGRRLVFEWRIPVGSLPQEQPS